MTALYLTTSIPYVNGTPHLGHALEFVHVDVLARHRAATGAPVRVQSGTDDHAIKNVAAAAERGLPVVELVRRNANLFRQLAEALGFRTDEFLQTSTDPRHPVGVATLWTACAGQGDLYRRDYTGRYCVGCEQFYTEDELTGGGCAEHSAEQLTEVCESNWFFRLSRYREQIRDLISSGRLEITPSERRNEVLGFLDGDVHDLSVSRPIERAAGWGIPVPDDPEQVVYVWFDALANYVTGLGYGTGDAHDLGTWWSDPAERTHVIGKGIVRFHAVYWIAFLLSAGLPLPTRILVHDYLTVDGSKISKSGAQAGDPVALVEQFGQDALRWWLLRDPARATTTDFTTARLRAAYNQDLANTIGNLASRTLALAWRGAPWRTAARPGLGPDLRAEASNLALVVDDALRRYDFRSATRAVVDLAANANRFLGSHAPWDLARAADLGDSAAAQQFEDVIHAVLFACTTIAQALEPFVPAGAQRLRQQLAARDGSSSAAFPRLGAEDVTLSHGNSRRPRDGRRP